MKTTPDLTLTEEQWWLLAERLPHQAMDHPFYDLLILAEPERWLALEDLHAQDWATTYLWRLDRPTKMLWMADCLENSLEAVQQTIHYCPTPEIVEAITARRMLSRSDTGHAEWLRCKKAIRKEHSRLCNPERDDPLETAHYWAIALAAFDAPMRTMDWCWLLERKSPANKRWRLRMLINYARGQEHHADTI